MTANNTINGRTPEEIKLGLECCNTFNVCHKCPYEKAVDVKHGWGCVVIRNADALAYIQRLERERDAAVEDMRQMAMGECDECDTCRFSVETSYSAIECRRPQIIAMENNDEVEGGTLICGWQWRGVPQEDKL